MSDVSTRSIVCQEAMEKRVLPRLLMEGTKAMIEAGEHFTPKYPAEDHDSYQTRLKGTTLFNALEITIMEMVGKPFSKAIQLNEDVPETIVEQFQNIDGQGRDVTAFFKDAFKDAMIDGISFIHVDFTRIQPSIEGEEPTFADQIVQGARPNAILYQANQILGFKSENINGVQTLTEIRIYEEITEADGEWGEVIVEQIKVLRQGSFELWRLNKDDKTGKSWYLYDVGAISLDYVPIVPIYVNRTKYMVGEPPLKSLAELNLEHWISSSDQRKALMFERFSMLVFTGVNATTQIDAGPDRVVKLQDPESKWGRIESTGKGIEAGRLDLEAIERRMQHAHMTVQLQNEQGDVTATAASIDSEESNAGLLAAAQSLQDSIDQVIQIFSDYQNLGEGGTSTVNKAFGRPKSKMTVPDMVSLMNAGVIDEQVIFAELQARGDLNEDLDFEEVNARAKEAMLNLMEMQGFGAKNEDPEKDEDPDDEKKDDKSSNFGEEKE